MVRIIYIQCIVQNNNFHDIIVSLLLTGVIPGGTMPGCTPPAAAAGDEMNEIDE